MSKISIIIPHHNGYEILNNCLKTLYNSDLHNSEIIIVNNNSNDDSIPKIKNDFQEIIILELQENRGYAGGCNHGVKHADGDFLVFLNNDTEVSKNWLTELISIMNIQSNISSAQPKILNKKNPNQFDYAGASGGFMDKYCYPFTRGRIFYSIENDHGQYDNPIQIFWASGTAFITKKSIFNELNGFDESLFAHMEEIDYHWRCQLKGYLIYVNPKSVIYHLGGGTLSYDSHYKTYLNHRNSLILLLSNYNIFNTLKILIPRLLMELISIVKDIITLRPTHAFAQIKSLLWIIFHMNIILKRRKIVSQIREISDDELLNNNIFNQSIVLQYFIKNKKVYSELLK